MPERQKENQLFAGFADKDASLFRRIGLPLGDPAAYVLFGDRSFAIVRDLEMDRVRKACDAEVSCPADHADGRTLSSDRETATAQALTWMLAGHQVDRISASRTLPLIYAWHLRQAGIEIDYDNELGVTDRRTKTERELDALQQSQSVTEQVMQQICETIAKATVSADGMLMHQGDILTSQRVRTMAAIEFLHRGYSMEHGAIVATTPDVADCHHRGDGPLRTGQPVVIDLFPRCQSTRYWGDCTRTVVHGEASPELTRMHAAVLAAKSAAIAKMFPGTLAGDVHATADEVLKAHGFADHRGQITEESSIQHGTGHGIGLEVHEPILLDVGGGPLLPNEVFTVEPGLYGRRDGGVRVEDMIVVTAEGPRNLNRLHEGMHWS